MGSPKVVDLERELAYLWFAVVWGLRRYVGCAGLWVWRYRGLRQYGVAAVWGLCHYLRGGGGVGHRWWVLVKCVVPRERDDVDVVLVRRDREVSLDEVEGFKVILQEVATGSRSRVGLMLEVGAILF
jgi:hypothetical protein